MITRRLALAGCAGLALSPLAAPFIARASTPEVANVRFSLDWAFQGPQSVFLLAEQRGYFREAGLTVTIDRGAGSADTVSRVASGAYDIGFGDINAMIQFNADPANRGKELIAFYVLFDASPLAVMTLRRTGIAKPKDLEGRKLGAPVTDGGRQMFPAFAKFAGIDLGKITWVTMTPQLREPMLARGEVDAITGFLTSGVLSLKGIGVPEQDIVIMRYREAGVPNYGSAIYCRAEYANRNPNTVRAFARAMTRGIRDAIADPRASIAALRARDNLINAEIELERLMLAHRELTLTDNVKANGLSSVDMARMKASIDVVVEVYNLGSTPAPETIYTDRFLPPREERMPPALGA